MRCEKARKWLSDESDAALAGRKKIRLERHVAVCPACRAYRSDLARIAGGVCRLAGPDMPAAYWEGFSRRLESRLEEAAAGPARPPRKAPLTGRWKWAWAGASFLVLAFAGTYLAVIRPHRFREVPPFVFEDTVSGALIEAGTNPALETAVNEVVIASIGESLGAGDEEPFFSFSESPMFWEGLSESELRDIEAALTDAQKQGGRS